ncbi:hypothetical protein ROZALSC1DRAFT_32006 [Rozella allomycis CSF55]|uniref:Histone-fold domain-containing protein n=1 Tax=Rozella allomycis (strain CSF55) TaxID=988480 RepID=A0A075B4Q0_ROZAC|nr:Histone-fold domain-containing protein [Rozella allomycis CSF55]RKP15691.1 hypothetical protein ROZALSC1DRAFT_32006 [Rozella allomycis CSF55]|eukprot:EPZ36529.1 Histone-fold domain-containing protein [Rozella allomycis CSF55]
MSTFELGTLQMIDREIQQLTAMLLNPALSSQQREIIEQRLNDRKRQKQAIEQKRATNGPHSLGKATINALLARLDPQERLDTDVEQVLCQLADSFVESVMNEACQLALHRGSKQVQLPDIMLPLEKNWDIKVPGFAEEEGKKITKRTTVVDAHKQRLAMIKRRRL